MDQYDHLNAFPENLAVLDQLKSLELKLGILSNGTMGMIDGATKSAGMDGYFDHILTVEHVKKYKTAPEVYQLGPDAFDLDTSQILFVSSNCWDACGATWFGYQTLWINRADMPVEVLGVEPCAIGKKLDAVLDYLS
jgi:2-haloacid dehalogenase